MEGGSFSTYAYVENNPVSYIDPEGLVFTAANLMSRDPMVSKNAVQIGAVGTAATGAGVATAAGVVVGGATAAATARVVGATAPPVVAACIKIARSNPCKNAILAAVLGDGICRGNPADDFPNDMKNREEIRRGAELAGQRKIGNQKQYP